MYPCICVPVYIIYSVYFGLNMRLNINYNRISVQIPQNACIISVSTAKD